MTKILIWEIVTGVILLVAHSTLIGMWLGRLTSRIKANENKAKMNQVALVQLRSDVDAQLCKHVTHDKCKGINDRWEIRLEAALKYRDGLESNNANEHSYILENMRSDSERFMVELERINRDRKEAAEKITNRLDKMSECLHNIQINLAKTKKDNKDD